MFTQVKYQGVLNVMDLCGLTWKNKVQPVVAEQIAESEAYILQLPRQIGKTWVSGLFAGITITAEGIVLIGAPTLEQATGLLMERADQRAIEIFNATGMDCASYSKSKDNTKYKKWTNGGILRALSLNFKKDKQDDFGQEGYTGNLLLFDEGHRKNVDIYGVFRPMVDDAFDSGTGRVGIMGVGGFQQSLIESKKRASGFTVIRIPAPECLEIDPSLERRFERARSELSDWEWAQHYLLKPAAMGQRNMFEDVPGEIDMTDLIKRVGKNPYHYFGVDVGKLVDSTIVVVMEKLGDCYNFVDMYEIAGLKYTEQAYHVYNWIDGKYTWNPDRISVERNGVGEAFADMLFDRFGSVRYTWTDYELKLGVWKQMNVDMREGRLGIKDERIRAEFEKLMYCVKVEDGKIEFEHSDIFMAAAMAYVGVATIRGL